MVDTKKGRDPGVRSRGRRAGGLHNAPSSGIASVPAKPLLTTGEAARALGISAQTVRNWIASGRLRAVRRGVRAMLPRDVVVAELERSEIPPARLAGLSVRSIQELPHDQQIYAWMERARAEGAHFPLAEYNARIPQEYVAEVQSRRAPDLELPAPWNEHFRPATLDDILSLGRAEE